MLQKIFVAHQSMYGRSILQHRGPRERTGRALLRRGTFSLKIDRMRILGVLGPVICGWNEIQDWGYDSSA